MTDELEIATYLLKQLSPMRVPDNAQIIGSLCLARTMIEFSKLSDVELRKAMDEALGLKPEMTREAWQP